MVSRGYEAGRRLGNSGTFQQGHTPHGLKGEKGETRNFLLFENSKNLQDFPEKIILPQWQENNPFSFSPMPEQTAIARAGNPRES